MQNVSVQDDSKLLLSHTAVVAFFTLYVESVAFASWGKFPWCKYGLLPCIYSLCSSHEDKLW